MTKFAASLLLGIALTATGCGTSSDSGSTTTEPARSTTTASAPAAEPQEAEDKYAAKIEEFEEFQQDYRPNTERYIAEHFCALSAAECACAQRKLNRRYVSAMALHDFVVQRIREEEAAVNEMTKAVLTCSVG